MFRLCWWYPRVNMAASTQHLHPHPRPHQANLGHSRLSRSRHHRPAALSGGIRAAVVQESLLIALPVVLALYHLTQLNLIQIQRQLPLLPVLVLAVSTLLLTVYRHCLHNPIYFRVPFTDQRGYRQSDQADDALSIAVGLPIVVCSALFLSSFTDLPHANQPPLTTPTHLMDIWNQSPQFPASNSTHHLLQFSQSDYFLSLSRARLDLLCFTILSLYALLLDLCLSLLAETLDYLPTNNSTRLIGSTIKSLLISIVFAVAVRFQLWGVAISQSMTPFECLFSVFTFQSSLYLTTRLARRAFTLAESSIFSSTSVALMIEVIRLTSARLRYSAYLHKQQQFQHRQPISDQDRLSFLPSLFRFPTPAIAIQHVLVSGIFLMAFTLAPLLVLSRRLGQRPTKRHRPLTRSPSNMKTSHSPARNHHPIQKPIWTSEPTQPDYYSRFSNPDSQHQSRQYESALKDNMRKIIALLIYASIGWIGLVVMSHWLGWLFEIGRNKTKLKHQTWWRRILGPGWMAFFSYSFLDVSSSDLIDPDLGHISLGMVNEVSIRWTRVGMLAYWCVCLMIGIGGWTGYLVQKRRSIRKRNRSVNDDQDLTKLIELDCHQTDATNWKSTLFNSNPMRSLAGSLLTDRSKKTPTHPHPSESTNQTAPTTNHSNPSPTSPDHTATPTPTNKTLNLKGPSSSHLGNGSFLGQCTNRKLINLVRAVKHFYNYWGNYSQEQEEISGGHLDGKEELDDRQQERLTRTKSNSSDKNIINVKKQQQTSLRSTSPSLLLPSASINSTTGSVKKEQLNFKRKFFHLLACLMFIPTIPLDIEFSSISFSVAFVIFTFCEFARYFAFYPIGAGIHLFFNEFIDSKDSGPVILSHFYLLTACSTGIWLDGLPTMVTARITTTTHSSYSALKWISSVLMFDRLSLSSPKMRRNPISSTSCSNLTSNKINSCLSIFNQQHDNYHSNTHCYGCKIEDLIGLLVLGFGDTFASVIGNRMGKIKWNRSSTKTVEGSIGFIVSVILLSLVLVMMGFVQRFSFFKYIISLILISLLEAFTNQNDNLILPLYSWSLLKLLLY